MAVDMFIKLGDIKGEAQDKVHKGEIDVLAWSWGLANTGTTHTGGGGGAGKVNVQDLSFTKYIDKSSPVLQLKVATGEHITQATLVCRKAGGTALEYLKITMTDILVSSLSTGGSGGEDRLTENVTLNFAKFETAYQEQDANGAAAGAPIKVGYHIQQNVKV